MIAVSSSAFSALLRRGAITHLEWLEACASRLDADGVVLAHDDLPRTDREYAAQVRKLATDLGIVPAALSVPGLLDPERPDAERSEAVELAGALGTGLVHVSAGPPGELPPQTFARTVAATKALAALAKAANLTLAVEPVAGSLLADLAELRSFAKYVDSAWLRYALPADRPSERLGPRERAVLAPLDLASDLQAREPPPRRGWLVLVGNGGEDPFARVAATLERLRADALRRQPQMPSIVPG